MNKNSYSVFYDKGLGIAYLYRFFTDDMKWCIAFSKDKKAIYDIFNNIQDGIYPSEKELFQDIYDRLCKGLSLLDILVANV